MMYLVKREYGLNRILFYKFKPAHNGSGLQQRARRKHGIGTNAAPVAYERTELMQAGRDALLIDMDIHRVVLALVIVVAKDSPCFNIHVVANDAITDEFEMGNSTTFEQHRGLHLATDAHLCTGSHKHSTAKIGVAANKAIGRDNRRSLDGHVVADDSRLMDSYSTLHLILIAEGLYEATDLLA